MINQDLEQFENRKDDWLAKERKRENQVSAWDIDEGKKIKIAHEEDCEAREIKQRHEAIHKAIREKEVSQIRKPESNRQALIIAMTIFVIAMITIIFISVASGMYMALPIAPFIIFVFILLLSTLTKGRIK